MEQLISLLPEMLKAFPNEPQVREAIVSAAWKKAAGFELNKHSLPNGVVEDRLSVVVRDHVWKRHLESLGAQLLFKVNNVLRSEEIHFIEFVVDEDRFEKQVIHGNDGGDIANLDQELIEKSEEIQDKDVREAFLKSAAAYLDKDE